MHIQQIGQGDGLRRTHLNEWVDICNTATTDLFGPGAPLTSVGRRRAAAGAMADRVTYYLASPDAGAAPTGAAALAYPSRTGDHIAEVEISVLPTARRQGVGRELLRHVESAARERGIRSLLLDQTSPTEHGGTGALFAAAHDYREFGLVVGSRLDLPIDASTRARLQAQVEDSIRARYEIFTASGELPDDWLEQRAALAGALSTQAPMGSMEPVRGTWDGERVRTMIMDWRTGGGTVIESVAVPQDRGAMVAFSDLVLFDDAPEEATQSDTLVLEEHRGHRLGLAVKLANLDAVMEERPRVRGIRTWTWAQNEPMRALNRELGFRDDQWTRLWAKQLAAE